MSTCVTLPINMRVKQIQIFTKKIKRAAFSHLLRNLQGTILGLLKALMTRCESHPSQIDLQFLLAAISMANIATKISA